MIVRCVSAWLCRRSALALLLATLSGLAAGGLAGLAGASMVQGAAWMASAACGLGYAIWSALESLRHGRVGVDVIALLALAGAVAVGELLAAAVISVMLTSGRSLETWAAERASSAFRSCRARSAAHASRARPLVSMTLITAAASSSPTATAPASASSAMISTPRRPRRRLSAADHTA